MVRYCLVWLRKYTLIKNYSLFWNWIIIKVAKFKYPNLHFHRYRLIVCDRIINYRKIYRNLKSAVSHLIKIASYYYYSYIMSDFLRRERLPPYGRKLRIFIRRLIHWSLHTISNTWKPSRSSQLTLLLVFHIPL